MQGKCYVWKTKLSYTIMKKFIAAVAVALCSLTANAQVWVGGSLGFSTTSPKVGNSVTKLTIAPTVGYKLSEKWELGLTLEEVATFRSGSTDNEFSVSPFARLDFWKGGIATLFVDGGFAIGTDGDNTTFGIGVRPGLKIELSKNLSLETKTGFFGLRSVSDSYTQFGLGVNNEDLSIGLAYEF